MKIVSYFIIFLIKIYQFLISPFFSASCRYLPTCSEYFIDSLKFNGTFRGLYLGIKRILRCHPIKILGGGSGFDPAPRVKKGKK